jgi:hypothetical protein
MRFRRMQSRERALRSLANGAACKLCPADIRKRKKLKSVGSARYRCGSHSRGSPMFRALLLVPALPAVYLASAAYWLVVSRIVERRLQLASR